MFVSLNNKKKNLQKLSDFWMSLSLSYVVMCYFKKKKRQILANFNVIYTYNLFFQVQFYRELMSFLKTQLGERIQ